MVVVVAFDDSLEFLKTLNEKMSGLIAGNRRASIQCCLQELCSGTVVEVGDVAKQSSGGLHRGRAAVWLMLYAVNIVSAGRWKFMFKSKEKLV